MLMVYTCLYHPFLVIWRRVYYYSTNMISEQFVGWDELHGVMGKPHGGSWTSSQSAEASTGILFHGLHTPDDLARLHLDFSLVHCLFLFADGCGDRLSFLIQRSSWTMDFTISMSQMRKHEPSRWPNMAHWLANHVVVAFPTATF